jgi:hypothetical protein
MTRSIVAVIGTMFVPCALACGTAADAAGQAGIEQRIEAIKLPESQRKWQRIPWITQLAEGQRLARQEQRPIFRWVTGDDPLVGMIAAARTYEGKVSHAEARLTGVGSYDVKTKQLRSFLLVSDGTYRMAPPHDKDLRTTAAAVEWRRGP